MHQAARRASCSAAGDASPLAGRRTPSRSTLPYRKQLEVFFRDKCLCHWCGRPVVFPPALAALQRFVRANGHSTPVPISILAGPVVTRRGSTTSALSLTTSRPLQRAALRILQVSWSPVVNATASRVIPLRGPTPPLIPGAAPGVAMASRPNGMAWPQCSWLSLVPSRMAWHNPIANGCRPLRLTTRLLASSQLEPGAATCPVPS